MHEIHQYNVSIHFGMASGSKIETRDLEKHIEKAIADAIGAFCMHEGLPLTMSPPMAIVGKEGEA